MGELYEFSTNAISDVKTQIENLAQQERVIKNAKNIRDRASRKQAEKERDKIHQQLLKSEASVVHAYLAATQEADEDSFRQAWQKWVLSTGDKPPQQLERWGLENLYQANWERPTIDLTPLPPCSWFLQFTFTLAKPYISKDDNPFYIIDNPIVRDKVFRLPMVRPTSWKGNLYSALWQLGHDKEEDAQMQRLFGVVRGKEEESGVEVGQAGRLFFYPTFFTQIGLEIINPHDRKRRVGKNPILFESVPIGAKGTFSLLYVPFDLIGQDEAEIKKQALADLQRVVEGLQAMFLTYGFSAKRTSGYGTAEDIVESGQLIHKIPGATFLRGSVPNTQKPEDVFLKYLDETGRVKPVFRGSGEGGLMSNSEYKKTGAQAGGGSFSEFKRFRAWYVAYGKGWQASLQHSATSTDYTVITFESLSQLVELCQNIERDTTNGGAT